MDELMELWNGVETYDALTNDTFMLRGALLWTINDFPAYGNLSGWKTKGYLACPYYHVDTSSYYLKRSKKLCYMGHRCLLDQNHPFRRCKAAFNGKVEERPLPKIRSGADLLYEMRKIKVTFGKHNKLPKCRKRKRKRTKKKKSEKTCLKKVSIFFTLSYWKDHLVRHNIDVMHTEKNVCESLLGTLLDIEGKTKDTLAAHFDLKDMKLKPKQHPVKVREEYEKPQAPFHMDTKAKEIFYKVLLSVKVPNGYASNIARRVDVKNGKLFGIKSHDCHIIMQQLLTLAVRKALPREISAVLIEVSNIFKELCSKDASFDEFEKL